MKHFIVSKNGNFIDVERIGAVIDVDSRSDVYVQGGGDIIIVEFAESPSEVRALIQKALGNEVSFTSSK